MRAPLFPPAASALASQTDHLFFILLGLSAFVLLLVFVPLIFFLFQYRRGHTANRARLHLPTNRIEITWTIIPTLITLGLFAGGAKVYFIEEVPPAKFTEVNVVGKQWMWKIEHPEGNAEINELHVPVNQAVKLILGSEDVIHSFYIPAFRLKQDVVPGRFSTEWFQPTRTGTYRFYCSEYCGLDHAKMEGLVYVMPAEEYQQWLARERPRTSLAQAGERLYRALGCSGCHDGQTSVHAPPLEGLYGALVPLSDGTTVTADDKYLRESILHPASRVIAGYQPVMPTYQGQLREEELMQLIAYIKSLAKAAPPNLP
jgi:cytochrome c oxidase subunit 2